MSASPRPFQSPAARAVLIASTAALVLVGGCVTGGGGTIGLYASTRGDVGVAFRGHANLLGFRVSDTPDTRPAGLPLLGVELGAARSLREDRWHLQAGLPIGAATWDDTESKHGIRVSPQFIADWSWKGDSSLTHEAYGGALTGACLRHLSMDSESYDGPDAIRIHRLGPEISISLLRDDAGWYGTLFVGILYDYEAYVATGR